MEKPRLVWKGQQAISRIRAASARGVEKAGRLYIQECLHLIFDTAKSGRVYIIDGGFHQASAPGEPPASQGGSLVSSFKLVVKELKAGPVGRVSNTADHAEMLEKGTPRMLPRPFMKPALERTGPGAFKVIRGELVAEFKRK